MDTLTLTSLPALPTFRDERDDPGFKPSNQEDEWQAHAAAQWFADRELHAEGHAYLKDWLKRHEDHGSRHVHLQWHLASFELETGRLDDALERFMEFILPAVPRREALGDAPDLLWRLALRTGLWDELPWKPLRDAVVISLHRSGDWRAQLYAALALAGARDLDNLDRFIRTRSGGGFELELVVLVAVGLRALVTNDPRRAVSALRAAVPALTERGDNPARNRLLWQILAAAEDSSFSPLSPDPG